MRNRSRPRCSATHWASTMSDVGVVDAPMARAFPLWTRSDSADSVTSMSVVGSNRWTWYTSMWSVCRRRREPLDRSHDPAPRGAVPVGVVTHRAAELGRQDDAVTTPFERPKAQAARAVTLSISPRTIMASTSAPGMKTASISSAMSGSRAFSSRSVPR